MSTFSHWNGTISHPVRPPLGLNLVLIQTWDQHVKVSSEKCEGVHVCSWENDLMESCLKVLSHHQFIKIEQPNPVQLYNKISWKISDFYTVWTKVVIFLDLEKDSLVVNVDAMQKTEILSENIQLYDVIFLFYHRFSCSVLQLLFWQVMKRKTDRTGSP